VTQCSWVKGGNRCAETEDLHVHRGRWCEARLLCTEHKLEVLLADHQPQTTRAAA
jgi:hypothetical protein